MNQIKSKSVTLQVSRIHSLGWWLGNSDEHVASGTALGSDFTENVYSPSAAGLIGKYELDTDSWVEVEDKSNFEFWSPVGERFVIGIPDGDYPEWAIKENPPEYDKDTQTILHDVNKWIIHEIELGKKYWNSDANEFIVSDYNFTLPVNHTFKEPPETGEGFVARLNKGEWAKIEDHRDKTIFNCDDCSQSEDVIEIGPIKINFTLDAPIALQDEWIDGAWVTNQSDKYIADYDRVDDTRRALYRDTCDPFFAEANVKRLQGDEQEAADIESQGLAARAKIQNENPWPTPLAP